MEERTLVGGRALGWLPEYPDFRDFTFDTEKVPDKIANLGQKDSIRDMAVKIGLGDAAKADLPASTDLREWCPPVEDQGTLGSCTANAGVGIMEYYERRAFGRHIDASRLFLYKATRNLLGWSGDTGAFIRTTMGAMALFGAPPEKYWPYNVADFDAEPSAFCYAFGQNYQSLQYFRLDPPEMAKDQLLKRIKTMLAAGLPSMFGFTVYTSVNQADKDGKIPLPCPGENISGGHAVVAVGFDDNIKIKNQPCSAKTKGALLIRNSWGLDWGEDGYGWLPYDYVLKGLAIDWWSLLKNEWVDTGRFGL